jgi:hypothetical protein
VTLDNYVTYFKLYEILKKGLKLKNFKIERLILWVGSNIRDQGYN